MPVCGNYLFFELPKKIVLNPKDGSQPPRSKITGMSSAAHMTPRSRHFNINITNASISILSEISSTC